MKVHLITVIVLLVAVGCYIAGLNGLGMVLFFAGAALEIFCWLRAVQAPRHGANRLLARIDPNR